MTKFKNKIIMGDYKSTYIWWINPRNGNSIEYSTIQHSGNYITWASSLVGETIEELEQAVKNDLAAKISKLFSEKNIILINIEIQKQLLEKIEKLEGYNSNG